MVSRRVLIVDDSPDDVEMLKRFLANEATAIRGVTDSAQVERAYDGKCRSGSRTETDFDVSS